MRAAGSGIPGRSVDDVRQHDEWYSEYLILKESKKKAIQEWKDSKEVCFTKCTELFPAPLSRIQKCPK